MTEISFIKRLFKSIMLITSHELMGSLWPDKYVILI